MNCKDVNEILDRWLDNVLTPAEAEALRRHLEICPSCCDSLRTYQDVVALARSLAKPDGQDPPPPGLVAAILARRGGQLPPG